MGLNLTSFLSVHVSADELAEAGLVQSWSAGPVAGECLRIPQRATESVCLPADPSTPAVQSRVLKVSAPFVDVGGDVDSDSGAF